jgi:hypothetical protein
MAVNVNASIDGVLLFMLCWDDDDGDVDVDDVCCVEGVSGSDNDAVSDNICCIMDNICSCVDAIQSN